MKMKESILDRWDDVLQRPSLILRDASSGQGRSEIPYTLDRILCLFDLQIRHARFWFVRHPPRPNFPRSIHRFVRDRYNVALSWPALFFVVCSMAVTVEPNDLVIVEWLTKQQDDRIQDTLAPSRSLQFTTLTCPFQDESLVRHDFNTLEASLLLIFPTCHLSLTLRLRCKKGSKKVNRNT